jgi:hypothetical protein
MSAITIIVLRFSELSNKQCTEGLERLWKVSSLATVTLSGSNVRHNPNQINKRPTFGTATCRFIYDGGEDRVLWCTESFKDDHKILFIEYQKEGKIERISLSGKFRRARMA